MTTTGMIRELHILLHHQCGRPGEQQKHNLYQKRRERASEAALSTMNELGTGEETRRAEMLKIPTQTDREREREEEGVQLVQVHTSES